MNKKDLEKNNIDNLTQLFKIMGASSHCYEHEKSFNISHSWPGKLWVDYNYDENDIQTLICKAVKEKISYTIPLWDKKDKSTLLSVKALEENGFIVTFEQIAMALDVEAVPLPTKNNLDIQYIGSKENINTWVQIASESFSYPINNKVIHNISKEENIDLLLAYKEGVAVGCALVFTNSNVAGVHLVGVPSSYRGQGIAQNIMQETIAFAKREQIRYITLQASALGLGIYKRLGFEEQFVLKNYMKRTIQP